MIKKNVRLIYPAEMVEVPVIHQLVRRFDLTVNILSANVTAEGGWVEIQLSGSEEELQEAQSWLAGMGIDIQSSNH